MMKRAPAGPKLDVAPGTRDNDPELELHDIQGDVLVGLQKNVEKFMFFEITDATVFKRRMKEKVIVRITTALVAHLREFQVIQRKALGGQGLLPLVGLNVGFTFDGLKALLGPDVVGFDKSFESGAMHRARDLNDPVDGKGRPSTWKPQFRSGRVDGVFLVTGPDEDVVGAESAELLSRLGNSVRVVYSEIGSVRPERGHEHFGFLDGVSQPGVRGLTARQNASDEDQGLPGQDLLWPGLFVFGYPGQDKVNHKKKGREPAMPFRWMRNGSYMVFRRLEQKVPEFRAFIAAQALELGIDPELLAARMVGRWRSGAPLMLAPLQDDDPLGNDPMRNNDFEFGSDGGQRRCPFAAHIRKTYPRDDLGDEGPIQVRRILRAGIPFGPEVGVEEDGQTKKERGLMFVCYQTSIVNQFEFVQMQWANNTQFVPGKKRPSNQAPVTPGHDPIIGQANQGGSRGRKMDEAVPNYPIGNQRSQLSMPKDFIVPTAAGYFFVPSITALRTALT